MSSSQQLQTAANDFVARFRSDPSFGAVAQQVQGILARMATPGQRAVSSVRIEINFGENDPQVIDMQPNHAGQIPSAQDPDA